MDIIPTYRAAIRSMLLFLILLSGSNLIAQSDTISAVTSTDAEHLIRDVFLGGGECFEVFNIQLSGQTGQAGVFSNGAASIGFSDGIILSNGSVNNISGPNVGHQLGDPATLSTGYGVSTADPDLVTLSMLEGDDNSNFFDPVVLEFDFTPTLDSISFEFVFASEEYCQFSLSSFIDLFGFFISGPGITGPYTDNGINIALVPGTNQAITARSISPFFNNSFYQNNIPPGQVGCSLNQAAPFSDFNAFDGFTVPLVATAQVIPCETYHLKLVVSDRGFDDQLDAAVFLKANSFAAGLTSRIASQITDGPNVGSNTSYEGCGSADIIFTRGDSVLTDDLTVYYNLLGNSTATPGLDYTPLPDSIVIPAGVFADTITIDFFADGLPEGTEFFTIELRNPCDCSASELTISILEPLPLIADIVGPDTICFGDGLLLAAVPTSGTGAISYEWENGDQDSIFNVLPLTSDTFRLTISDECDNSLMLEHSIHVQSPTGNLDGSFTICEGQSFVALPITLADGTNFTFDFFADGIPTNYTDIPAGVFQIPVTTTGVYEIMNLSADGCAGTSMGVADVLALDISTTVQIDSIDCFDDNNGAIEVFPIGGNAPYSYSWSHQSNLDTNLIEGLDVGMYSVFISDEIGCLDTISVTLDQPSLLEMEVDTLNLFADCTTPGSLEGQASGGVAPYSFSWSNGVMQALNDDLAGGNYTLSVTDANNCLQTLTTEIQGDSLLPIVMIEALDSLDCETFSIMLDASMSTQNGNLTYTWTNSMGAILPTPDPLMLSVNGPDTYTLTIFNNDNSCESSENIIVDFYSTGLDVSIGGQGELDCIQEEIELFADGADPAWTIDWEAIDGTSLATNSPTFTAGTAGTYVLLATQAGTGCTGRDTVTITANITPPVSELVVIPDSLNCNIGQVSIDTDVLTGSGNYTFNWIGPAGGLGSDPTLADLTAIEAGDYQLITQDLENGCLDTLVVEIIESLTALAINPLPDTLLDCNTPLVELTASSSASGNLEFSWEDAAGMPISNTATAQLTEIGTYVVQVTQTDSGCMGSETVIVTGDFDGPTVNLNGIPDSLDCDISQVDILTTTTSGSGMYTYQWTGPTDGLDSDPTLENVIVTEAGTYQLITEDLDNGCTDTLLTTIIENPGDLIIDPLPDTLINCYNSPLELTATSPEVGVLNFSWQNPLGMTISNSATAMIDDPGIYTVRLENADNTCFQIMEVVVDVDTLAPFVTPDLPGDISCAENTVTLSTSPGLANYVPIWRTATGEILLSTTWSQEVTEPGGYSLTVRDTLNGCVSTILFEVGTDTIAPMISIDPLDSLTCVLDTIQLRPMLANGAGDYIYQWNGPLGGIVGSTDVQDIDVTIGGNYTLTVTDQNNGCADTLVNEIIVNQDTPTLDMLNDTLLNCYVPTVMLSGSSVSSGTLAYQWLDQTGGILSNTADLEITAMGAYELQVVNTSNGCFDVLEITVTEDFIAPQVEAGEDTTIGCEATTATLEGNIGAINWVPSWLDADGTPVSTGSWSFTTNVAGTYDLVVIDTLNGCTATDDATIITDQNAPTAEAGPAIVILDCFIGNATIDLSNSTQGPTIMYTLLDASGTVVEQSTQPNFTLSTPGDYQVIVTNTDNECQAMDTFSLTTEEPTIDAVITNDIGCGEQTGSIIFDVVSNGNAPYLYSIDGGAIFVSDNVFTNLGAGSYDLVVQDMNGCEAQAATGISTTNIFEIILPEQVNLKLGDTYNLVPIIDRLEDQLASISWSNDPQLSCVDCLEPVFTAEETTFLELTLVDLNGCSSTAKILFIVDQTVPIYVPNVFSPNNGDGVNDGFTIYGDPAQVERVETFQIYDRWGNAIFSNTQFPINVPQEGWDGLANGKKLNRGVFVYWAEVLLRNGELVIVKGDVLLVE